MGRSPVQRWLVSGRVQGVGFRWFVLRAAQKGSCRGDVRNLPDGDVEVRVVGPEPDLAALLAEVRRGPRAARVREVIVDELEEPSLSETWTEFTIRR